jgi:hypothetical protein
LFARFCLFSFQRTKSLYKRSDKKYDTAFLLICQFKNIPF